MNTEDEKGQQMVPTPGGPLTSPEEASEGYELVRTPVDYDSEDVQLSARVDDGDVVMYLPEITYLDTQPWSVEIGLTPERLVQLRDALNNHLRGAADHAGPANRVDTDTVARSREDLANGSRGDTPTTGPDGGTACPPVVTETVTAVGKPPIAVAQQATTVTDTVTVAQQATVSLRERLRTALRHHIDPDDDTMPTLDHGGFVWVDTDDVLDSLIRALDGPNPIEALARVSAAMNTPAGPPDEPTSEYSIGWDAAMDLIEKAIGGHQPPARRYPITSHAYEGDRFLHPCTARGYGSMCGATEYDHMEPE